MEKKRYVLPAASRLLVAWMLFGGALLSVLFYLAVVRQAFFVPWVIAIGACYALLTAAFFRYVWLPAQHIAKHQQMFVGDQMYDELFRMKAYLSPGEEAVFQHFRHLLSKQDVLVLSKKQAEYLALQNQINPHFLYNTLEAIRGDALCSGARGIAQTTEALATFFRYTITEVEDLVTVEDELENVQNYFTIQQYRFGEKLRMDILMEDAPEAYRCQIPKLTLQPIVENAIYHGLENKPQGGLIQIRVETTQKRLLISVKDNGKGMDGEEVLSINRKLEKVAVSFINDSKSNDSKKKRGGIALRNVAQRIKLLFGEEYGIHLFSTRGVGTEVQVMLPKLPKDQRKAGNA